MARRVVNRPEPSQGLADPTAAAGVAQGEVAEAAEPVAEPIGTTLQAARRSRGESLAAVASMLRIKEVYLDAIERGAYEELPGRAYAYGFVRSYAKHLGLDGAWAVAQFKTENGLDRASPSYSMPATAPETRVSLPAVLLVVGVLAGGVYGGWHYLSASERSFGDLVAPVPDSLLAMLNDGGDGDSDTPTPPAVPERSEATGESGDVPRLVQGPDPDARFEGTSAPSDAALASTESEGDSDTTGLTVMIEGPETAESRTIVDAIDELARLPEDAYARAAEAADPAEIIARAPVEITRPDDEVALTADAAMPKMNAVQDLRVAAAPSAEAVPRPARPSTNIGPLAATDQDSARGAGTTELPASAEAGTTTAARETAAADTDSGDGDVPATPAADNDEPAPAEGYGADPASARVVLEAQEETWIQVRDAAGNLAFTQVLGAGERYYVPNESGYTLVTGNADGLVIYVDGDHVPALADEERIVRDVSLDPARLTERAS